MSTETDLWALQTTDLAVEAIKHRLAELEKQRGAGEALRSARTAAAEAQAELKRWQAAQRELDRQINELADHARAAEREMMSGRVRNPRELEGMEANLAALQRRRSALEDQALAAMLEVDRWQAEANQRHSDLANAEAAHEARQEAIQREAARQIAELKTLSARLNRQWEAMAPPDRELYKSLRSRKGGRAVALEQGGACQACGLILPTGALQAVHSGSQRIFCPGCGRLLVAG